jgi:hypothetical protein
MPNVTVPGAGYCPPVYQGEPCRDMEIRENIALAIARALERQAYIAYERAFHRHEHHNTADSAAEHDEAHRALTDATAARLRVENNT